MPSVNDLILTITHNAQQTTSSTVDYHGNKYLSNYIAEEPEQMKPEPNWNQTTIKFLKVLRTRTELNPNH